MYDNVCMRNLLLRAILAFAAVQLVSSTAHTTPAPTPTPQPAVLYFSISDSQMKAHIQGHVHGSKDPDSQMALTAISVLFFGAILLAIGRGAFVTAREQRFQHLPGDLDNRRLSSRSIRKRAGTGDSPTMPRMV